MFIFQFLLVILLMGLFAAVFVGLYFLKRIQDFFNLGKTRNRGYQQTRQSHAHAGKERVVDQRDPQKARQKIFSEDEGEYVDFTEE